MINVNRRSSHSKQAVAKSGTGTWDGYAGTGTRGRVFGDVEREDARWGTRGDVRLGTRGRENGDVGNSRKAEKVTINRSKKLVSSNKQRKLRLFFIYPHRPRREETRRLS